MRMGALLVAFCLLLASHRVYAQTAEEMASDCKEVAEASIINGQVMVPTDFESGVCWGAFASFNTATHFVGNDMMLLFRICYPRDVTRSQEIKIFLAYAGKHPEELNKEYFVVALTANREAFPCKGTP
jgi:Rap1a immunity proteins